MQRSSSEFPASESTSEVMVADTRLPDSLPVDSKVEALGAASNLTASEGSLSDVGALPDGDASDGARLWRACAERLEATTDPHVYSAYIKPLRLKSLTRAAGRGANKTTNASSNTLLNSSIAGDDLVTAQSGADEIVISAPNKFLRNYIESNFSSKLAHVLGELRGGTVNNLRFVVDADIGSPDLTTTPGAEPGTSRSRDYVVVKSSISSIASSSVANFSDSGLNSRYTFDNFVVGSGNQFCHAAAMRVAEQPGKSYNPLFIYGGVGLGKTHLLHAIGNAVLARTPSARVAYMSSEAFTNELIQSLRNAKMDEFKSRLRNIEVLLIDDIQFICGKERTQEEFFHTFNSLYGAKHQIVITSDKIPSKIPGIEERLQTRFSWGLTADIQAPDFETRVAIVRRKAALDGFALAEEVAVVLAENISSNVRELEGALTHLQAKSAITGVLLTPEVARSLIRPFVQSTPVCISVDDIKRAVSNHFSIKVSDIISKRRTKNLSWPRHIAMYLCRKHTTASYPEIGNQFGGRDHSSVIHAANVVTTKVAADVAVQQLVREIEKKLLGD